VKRSARRPLLVLALVVAAGAGWFVLLPELALPSGPVAAVAPGTSEVPSPSPTASIGPSPSASSPSSTPAASPPQPTPTPTRLPTTIDARRAALSAALDRLKATYGIPGISAAMTFADGSSWVGTTGLAVVAGHRAVTTSTAFAAGSISKTFTAALVMALAEEGRLALDSPVKTYLPKLVVNPAITVRELLDHTSGLDDFFSHPAIDKALLAHRARVWTAADSLRYVGKAYFKPGMGWHYSNTNYLVLGMLAEAVGRAPLADQLRQRFFDPLGLNHTIYQAVEHPRGPVAHGYRFSGPDPKLKGVDVSDGTAVVPFTSVVTAAGGAGSIATTASDLATWARALYGGGVLRPETVASMVDDAAVTTALKSSVPYGLGVQVVTIDGRPTLGHSGRLLGFRAVMRWLPDQGIAVVVMTNQGRTDPGLLIRDLLRTVLGVPPVCVGCPQRP
jgi:Beta-lactamase class C and other penicillin binding proteins